MTVRPWLAPLLTPAIALTLLAAAPATRAAAGDPIAAAPAANPPVAATCGDGLLGSDETCESCPADCQPTTCKTKGRRKVIVELTPQNGYDTVGAVTVLLAYRKGVLSLPGEKDAPAVRARVKARQKTAQTFVNDLGYALRVVASSKDGLPAGPLLDVELDTCAGAPAAKADDLSCRVESCAQGGGRLRSCGCSVSLP
jgi:hypothetical protein